MQRPLLVTFGLALGLTACSPASISGEVGGEKVPAPADAAYDTYEFDIPFVGTVEIMALVISDAPDFCETWGQFADNVELDCAEQCEDWVRIAEDDLGKDAYYNMTLYSTFDPARPEGEYRMGGSLPAENEFTGAYTTHDTSHLYDQDGCVEWCEAGNPVVPNEESNPSGGSLTVDSFDRDNEQVRGSFELDFGDDTVTGDFKARRCDEISTWFGLQE